MKNQKSFIIFFLTALVVVSLSPALVLAQLTKDDITALKKQGAAEGWTFKVTANPATEYSIDQLCGTVEPEGWRENGHFVDFTDKADLPERFDWRDSAGSIPIRNQGGCGSCWAFSTVGALECNILLKDGDIVDLSEQWLVSCNRAGWGCGGGWFAHGYHESITDICGGTGAVYEGDFPYVAYDAPCNCPYPHHYKIDGWGYIGPQYGMPTVSAIKQAILDYGPVSVCVTVGPAFQAYGGGVFTVNDPDQINHAVVLVGWDDNDGPGVWIMRNSWGPYWGENGYMRIMYGVSSIGYGATFIDYAGAQQLTFSYPNGYPYTLQADAPTTFQVDITGVSGTPVPGSGQLYYSVDGGPVTSVAMTQVSDNNYDATLPALTCENNVSYYVSVETTRGKVIYDPDPSTPRTPVVISSSNTIMNDDFELDDGWTVDGDAVDGQWNRGVPAGDGTRGDPTEDFDGSGQCFLTDNVAGNSDVDMGSTNLISPTFNISNKQGMVTYARWFCNDATSSPDDIFRVYVSNDNGQNWVEAEAVGPEDACSSGGWNIYTFFTNDFVTSTDQMKVRFEASDLGNSSCVEAAIDAVRIATYRCGSFICGDVNCSEGEEPDISDITRMIDFLYVTHDPLCCDMAAADVNGSGGTPDMSDIVQLIAHLYGDGRSLSCQK